METYLEKGEVDARGAARAARAGAARGAPDPGVLRLGEDRRRHRRAARRDRQAAAEPDRGQSAGLLSTPTARRRRRPSCTPIPDPSRHVLAHVFKVEIDPYVGRSLCSACTRGASRRTPSSTSATAASRSRSATCSCCRARSRPRCSEALPGDICAVAKIDEIQFDAILHDSAEDAHIHPRPLELPIPVLGLAVEPKKRGDEQRMSDVLHKLARRGSRASASSTTRRPTRP